MRRPVCRCSSDTVPSSIDADGEHAFRIERGVDGHAVASGGGRDARGDRSAATRSVRRHVVDPRRHAVTDDEIVVRIVPRRFDARVPCLAAEHLQRTEPGNRSACAEAMPSPRRRDRRRSRTDRHVGDELFDVDERDARPRAVPPGCARRPSAASRSRASRASTASWPISVEQRVVANAARLIDRRTEAQLHRRRDFVDRAAAQRVVRMRGRAGSRHASSSERAARPHVARASALHGSASRISDRSASAFSRFSCARVAKVPCSVQV